jgi:uncharacterized protein YndB with AHSA1/START domain
MNLLFDFTADKATNTIYITREFAADLDLVWDAFTKSEILDQWVGPKPYRVQTKEMDFRVGGRWLYTMIGADITPGRYSLAEFTDIQPKSSFTTRNTFSDENGNPLSDGFSITTNSFKAGPDKTTVSISKKMSSLALLEQFAQQGFFKEGTAMGFRNLDEYFLTLVANK